MDKTPSKAPSHCAGFYIRNNSETTVLCTYEYSPTAMINILAPYQSTSKGSGNSWLSLALYWGEAGLVYHIGQDPKGVHAIFVSQANRLFYDGKHGINYKNIQGDLHCAAIDNNDFLWVGTSRGMFKSTSKIPPFK